MVIVVLQAATQLKISFNLFLWNCISEEKLQEKKSVLLLEALL